MSLVSGLRSGLRSALRSGLSPTDAANPLATVTRDATSGIYSPATAAEWATFAAVAGIPGNPSGGYPCQDASGNLTDSIGANPLVVTGAPAYQQAVTGWSRKGVGFSSTVGQIWQVGAGVFNPAATSVAWLSWVLTPATPGGARNIITISNGATGVRVDHNGSNKLVLTCGANTATSVGSYTLAAAYPILLVYNLTLSTFTLYTHLEALSCTFAAAVDGSKGFGAVVANSDSGARHLFGAVFTAAAAGFTTTTARSLLSTAGWSPAF